MVETAKNVLLILSALFPIVNPLGGSPVFLALTRDYPTSARRALARQVAVNSFILLIASFMVGTHILNFFGISIPVVQVGGGLVVVSNGWAMLKQKEEPDRGRDVQKKVDLQDIFRNAFYPLTLPLTVGPGSISVAMYSRRSTRAVSRSIQARPRAPTVIARSSPLGPVQTSRPCECARFVSYS